MLGLDREQLRDRRLGEIQGLEELPSPERLERRGWEGSVRVASDARWSEVHLFAAAVSHDDPPGYQILLVDRTAEVAQEREIERQGRLATLGEALAGVAHELNNPLSVITAWSGLASGPDASEEERREGFEVIGEQATRMQDLVKELKGTEMEADIRWRGEAPVSGGKLEQILVNLLSNAADAAPEDGGRVMLTLEEEEGEVVVRVSDKGPGIPPQVRDRIFEPFFTTKPEGEGTGLGLPISRRLASAMGGDLAVDEAPDGGAHFTLRLPAASHSTSRGAPDAVEVASEIP